MTTQEAMNASRIRIAWHDLHMPHLNRMAVAYERHYTNALNEWFVSGYELNNEQPHKYLVIFESCDGIRFEQIT